jgi:hypothetical protein
MMLGDNDFAAALFRAFTCDKKEVRDDYIGIFDVFSCREKMRTWLFQNMQLVLAKYWRERQRTR